jgi:cytosine/adenosine deaminase-related metal-dependent hydrolase
LLIIKGGTVITGDGTTVLDEAAIYIDGDRIVDIKEGGPGQTGDHDHVLDATGQVVIPGMINAHTHGVGFGPRFATAASALPREQVLKNLDEHLRFGTTSVIDLDGFALPEEVEDANRSHPVNVFLATSHMPVNKQVAQEADAEGMTEAHSAMTTEKTIAAGAVLIGEIGGGHTLGGGGQDYMYIPMAVEEATGVRLEPRQARKLKEAVLSRFIRAEAYDEATVDAVLDELELSGKLSATQARDLVQGCVLPTFQMALDGFIEAADYAERYGLPTLVHNSAPSSDATHQIAERLGPLLIAGHTNHSTYTPEEAVESGRLLRRHGAVVEICTLDAWGAKRLESGPTHIYALLEADLVDTIGTDYAGGFWDSVLLGIQNMVSDGVVPLAKAIALASRNVARAVPRVGERGEIAPGKIADLVIAPQSEISSVRAVIVSGRVAYQDGHVMYGETARA